jgi:CubicO group peptidase (beta-lactamase class C family)
VSKSPATPKTLFYTASTTKSFTAAAFSLLVNDPTHYPGLDYTTPISSILPEDFVLSDDWATKHITFEDALCHRSGYPRHDMAYGNPNATLSDILRTLRYVPMTAEPRTQWQYQNCMFVAISLAIEKLTGTWLGDFLRERIWGPLGMESTFFSNADARAYVEKASDPDVSLATPYVWIPADRDNVTPLAKTSVSDHYVKEPWVSPASNSGAGANISTVLDYLKYLDCMIHEAEPIPKAAHKELRKPRIPLFEPYLQTSSDQETPLVGPTLYCLGWLHDVSARRGSKAVEIWHHGGGLYGFAAEMRYIPDLDLGIVTMGNALPGGNLAGSHLCERIIDDVLGVKGEDRFDWKKEYLCKEEMVAKDLEGKRGSLFEGLDVKARGTAPMRLEEYVGVFENMGYQSMAVSIVERPGTNKEAQEKCLRVTPSARMWVDVLELSHVHEDWFLADRFCQYPNSEKHVKAGPGPGRLQGRARALFKRGQDGKVRSMGLEWEEALVAKAAKDAKLSGETKSGVSVEEKEGHDWKAVEKGMIWFDKVEKEMFTVERCSENDS